MCNQWYPTFHPQMWSDSDREEARRLARALRAAHLGSADVMVRIPTFIPNERDIEQAETQLNTHRWAAENRALKGR